VKPRISNEKADGDRYHVPLSLMSPYLSTLKISGHLKHTIPTCSSGEFRTLTVKLTNDAVKLDATALYADMADSTRMVDYSGKFSTTRSYKSFPHCAAEIMDITYLRHKRQRSKIETP
jgi:hypothetical protein